MCIYGQRDLSVMDFWRDKYVTCVCPPKVSWSYRCMTKVLCHLFLKLLAAASKNVSLKNSRRWSVDRHWRILSRIFENSSIAKRGTPDTCMETTLWELILSWKWAKWVSTATWSRKRVWKRSSAKTPILVSFPDRTFKLLSDIFLTLFCF